MKNNSRYLWGEFGYKAERNFLIMSYEREQRIIQQEFFKGKCGGRFGKEEYPFVLREEYRKQNLFDQISDEAINYFKLNNIGWWRGINGLPTNHTLSSQISCVNHLFWLKDNFRAATATLQEIDPYFAALPFENGNYVEFELNGCDENHTHNYLGERSSTRGANTTSIDACMLAKKYNDAFKNGIQYKETNNIYTSLATSAGTMAVGGVLKFVLASTVNIPFVVIVAGAIAVFCATYFKAVPDRNKAAFNKAINKFFDGIKKDFIEWFDEIEIYYNHKIEELISSF